MDPSSCVQACQVSHSSILSVFSDHSFSSNPPCNNKPIPHIYSTSGTKIFKNLKENFNKTFYYYMSSFSLKSCVELDPSEETFSVVFLPVVPLFHPPMSRTSPEGSPQHRCSNLSSTRVTGSFVKVKFLSNFSQDLLL